MFDTGGKMSAHRREGRKAMRASPATAPSIAKDGETRLPRPLPSPVTKAAIEPPSVATKRTARVSAAVRMPLILMSSTRMRGRGPASIPEGDEIRIGVCGWTGLRTIPGCKRHSSPSGEAMRTLDVRARR